MPEMYSAPVPSTSIDASPSVKLPPRKVEYSSVVPSSAESDDGLFLVHQVDGNILFEIPDAVLGRDMLIMSRYDKTQDGYASVGAMMAGNLLVRWQRQSDFRIGYNAMRLENHAGAERRSTAHGEFARRDPHGPPCGRLPRRARRDLPRG